MALLIIGFLIGFVLAMWHFGTPHDSEDFMFSFVCGFIGAVISFVLVFTLTLAVVPDTEYTIESNEQKIVALSDNQQFLSRSVTDNTMKFYYATEDKNGIRVDSVNAAKTYIRNDNDNPRIQEFFTTGFEHWYTWLYALPLDGPKYYVFYVPDGTVDKIYSIDLQ